MGNTVHERICSRAADVLSVAVSGPGRRCSVVERADPDVARSTVRPTLMWPDRVLEPTAALPLAAPCAGKHPHQAQ
jgi:hypothetical protein